MASSNFAAGTYAAVQNIGALKGAPKVQPTQSAGGDFTRRRGHANANVGAAGKANVVDVVTAVAESETALQTMVAVRDRMISAYEEIMRMQI